MGERRSRGRLVAVFFFLRLDDGSDWLYMNVQIFSNYFFHHIALGVWYQTHADQVTILLSLSVPCFWQCSRVLKSGPA